MPIDLIVDSLDSVDSSLRDAYIETDGKFQLDPDKYHALKAAPLATKNRQLLDEKKKLQDATKPFERLKPIAELLGDADEEEITGFLEAYKNRQAGGGKSPTDPDATKQLELKDKLHAKELKKREDQLAQIQADYERTQRELKEFRLWTPLRDIAIKANLSPEDWELARLDLSAQGRFGFDEDGKIVVLEEGQPSSITPEKFFKEVYSDQRPKFYKASAAGGSGAPSQSSSGRGPKTMKRGDWNQLTPAKQAAFFKEGGTLTD